MCVCFDRLCVACVPSVTWVICLLSIPVLLCVLIFPYFVHNVRFVCVLNLRVCCPYAVKLSVHLQMQTVLVLLCVSVLSCVLSLPCDDSCVIHSVCCPVCLSTRMLSLMLSDCQSHRLRVCHLSSVSPMHQLICFI